MEFDGKICVVTGATSGIGMATARKLASEGARVAAVGRNSDKLATLNETPGEGIRTYRADLSDTQATEKFAASVLNDFAGVDILVNAAGILGMGTVESTPLAAYDEMMNINVRSVLHLTQLFLPSIIERKGNIVNLSSVTGPRAFPGVLTYCISKAAIDQLTRCAALELAPKGVRVNAVNPGVVRTNLHLNAGMSSQAYEAFAERSKITHPLGRIGTPEEVADLIVFLASSKAGWITGGTFPIDGGRGQTCAR